GFAGDLTPRRRRAAGRLSGVCLWGVPRTGPVGSPVRTGGVPPRTAGPHDQPEAPPVKFHDARCSAGALHQRRPQPDGCSDATGPTALTAPGPRACGYDWVKRRFCTGVVTLPSSISHTPFRVSPVMRSEEHTSELQSRENLVCRLL